MTATVLLLTGFVVFYSSSHDMPAIPAGYYGIATLHEEWLGWTGTLTIDGQEWPVIVCDYTHPDDVALVQGRGIIAEVSWQHAGEIPHLRRNGRLFGRLWLQAPGEVTECPQPL